MQLPYSDQEKYDITHPVLKGLREQNKISDVRTEGGFVKVHYWKSFLSGGIEITTTEPDAEQNIVERCRIELEKEKKSLAEEILVLNSQVGARERARERTIKLLNEFF